MTQTFDHGYALLVGVGDIANYPKWSLPVTVKDMAALSNLLVDPALCAYPESEDHVRLLHDQKANSPEILNALAWLGTCAQHNPVRPPLWFFTLVMDGWMKILVYYYLIPHDVEPFDVQGSRIVCRRFQYGDRRYPCQTDYSSSSIAVTRRVWPLLKIPGR